jgi:hypothetical protein
MNWFNKYYKYKIKYLRLRKLVGGKYDKFIKFTEDFKCYSCIFNKYQIMISNPKEQNDNIIPLGSISKIFLFITIKLFEKSNLIKLDIPINSYISLYNLHDLTINDLLFHHSSLDKKAYHKDFLNKYLTYDDTLNYSIIKPYSVVDFINFITKQNIIRCDEFNYNSANYVILSLIVEKIIGYPIFYIIKKMILDKLDMTNTHINTFDDLLIINKTYDIKYDILFGDFDMSANLISSMSDLNKLISNIEIRNIIKTNDFYYKKEYNYIHCDGYNSGALTNLISFDSEETIMCFNPYFNKVDSKLYFDTQFNLLKNQS